jgi:hypothetical protein
MLERPITPATIPEIREKVTNKTAYVQKRSDIILQDTLMGHYEVGFASLVMLSFPSKAHCCGSQGRWEFIQ